MKVRSYISCVALVIVVVAGFTTSTALAQTSTPTTPSTPGVPTIKSAPLAEGIYQVQVAPEVAGGQSAVIVAVQLPPNVKLPAMVRIPVPQGATPTWVGEILGGNPNADPARQYREAEGTGGQVLEVTLEQTRTAQAEFTVASTSGAGNLTVTWIQSSPSEKTEFSVRMPAGASATQITPTPEGSPATNELGETLYALPTKVMKPGETSVIAVSYASAQTGQGGQSTGASGGSTVFYAIVIVFVLVVAILGFLLLSRRPNKS